MSELASILSALGEFVWPATLIGLAIYFRSNLSSVFQAIKTQISQGASLKYGQIELNGIRIEDFPLAESGNYELLPADKVLLDDRERLYNEQKNVFLVHRFKNTDLIHKDTQLPVYDISVYLIPHKNYGALNNIKEVEYYFGQYFDKSKDRPYGAKYVVKNSVDGFAVRVTAYGPSLCEARVFYHDGTTCLMKRYLDFEGSGYRFDPKVSVHDAKRVKRKR